MNATVEQPLKFSRVISDAVNETNDDFMPADQREKLVEDTTLLTVFDDNTMITVSFFTILGQHQADQGRANSYRGMRCVLRINGGKRSPRRYVAESRIANIDAQALKSLEFLRKVRSFNTAHEGRQIALRKALILTAAEFNLELPARGASAEKKRKFRQQYSKTLNRWKDAKARVWSAFSTSSKREAINKSIKERNTPPGERRNNTLEKRRRKIRQRVNRILKTAKDAPALNAIAQKLPELVVVPPAKNGQKPKPKPPVSLQQAAKAAQEERTTGGGGVQPKDHILRRVVATLRAFGQPMKLEALVKGMIADGWDHRYKSPVEVVRRITTTTAEGKKFITRTKAGTGSAQLFGLKKQ